VYEINDPIIKEFLDSIERPATKNCYKTFLKRYLDWTGKTGQQLINEKKAHPDDGFVEKSLLRFRKAILDNGKSTNYASSALGAVGGFYHYNRCKLNLTQSESKRLRQRERKTQDYHFEKDDFERMAKVANLKEKYVLFVGKAVGLRGSDFLKFTYGHFRAAKLNNDVPIMLGEFITHKEAEKAFPFLDTDALQVVKDWLEINKTESSDELILNDTEDNLSLILQNLCRKAGFEIKGSTIHGKRVRFHCLRKFLTERLSVHSSESQWKQIVGKAIGEGAYISQEQLRVVYAKAMKDITINGSWNGAKNKKIVELEQAIVESQNRLTAVEITNEVLRKELDNLTKQLSEAKEWYNQAKPLIENVDEIVEFLNKRNEEKYIEDEVKRQEQEAEELAPLIDEINKKTFVWKLIREKNSPTNK
jgi:hypothetical protein